MGWDGKTPRGRVAWRLPDVGGCVGSCLNSMRAHFMKVHVKFVFLTPYTSHTLNFGSASAHGSVFKGENAKQNFAAHQCKMGAEPLPAANLD